MKMDKIKKFGWTLLRLAEDGNMIEDFERSYKTYAADGTTKSWEFPYPYSSTDSIDLYIKHDGILTQIEKQNYTVTTEQVNSVVKTYVNYPLVDGATPVPSGDTILIWRETEITQEEDSSDSNFKSNDIERMVDKLTLIAQELHDDFTKTVHFQPTDTYNSDANYYIQTINDAKDTAVTKASEASSSALSASASASNSQKWAEGTDEEVSALGGTHSSKGWAAISQTAAESENVQTIIAHMQDIEDVADIASDVSNVASIKSDVSNVSAKADDVSVVSDNLTTISTVATDISAVNTVSGISSAVSTVATNNTAVSTVATNISSVAAVASNSANINAVADNNTNINAVNSNKTNINKVAAIDSAVSTVATHISDVDNVSTNITTISAVNDNKTNINAVAGNSTNINAVAGNATNINAVNANKTNIDTVAGDKTNIDNVATYISQVRLVADDISSVRTVATDISNVIDVSADLTNIDLVAGSLSDIQDKQNKVLTTPITVDGTTQTTVEGALGAINTLAAGKQAAFTIIDGGDSTNA